MTSVDDTHSETAEIIADAVADIAQRAITPALDPFAAELKAATGRLDKKIRENDEVFAEAQRSNAGILRSLRGVEELLSRLDVKIDQIPNAVASGVHGAIQRMEGDAQTALTNQAGELAELRKEVATLNAAHHEIAANNRALNTQVSRVESSSRLVLLALCIFTAVATIALILLVLNLT